MKFLHSMFILIAVSASAVAQTELTRSSFHLPDSNKASIHFERNVNTYLWNANAKYLYDDKDYYVQWTNALTSSYILSQLSSFRDEQNVSLTTSKKISGPFAAVAEGQSFVLSDNQTLGGSSAGIHTGAAGISYQPSQHFLFSPMVGFRYDKQQSQRDEGINYRLYSEADSLVFGEYRAGFSGHLNQSDLGNRRFKNNLAAMNIVTAFSSGSSDSVSVHWGLNRNDFYVPADSTIFNTFGTTLNVRSRTQQLWGVENNLSYDIGSGFRSHLVMNVESQSIVNAFKYKPLAVITSIPFNTLVQEFRIDGSFSVDYTTAAVLASLGFQLGERNEKHQLERLEGIDELFQDKRSRQESRQDNTALRNSLNANVFVAWSARDQLYFSSSVSIMHYDTPDTVNTDDRDEQLMNISMKETHRFSPSLFGSLITDVTLSHLVYLSREKSANNNWNRIFRTQTELFYRPSDAFRMFNAFEVLANYTVFDYEALVSSVKSYSYRQVAFLDSTSYDMTKRVGFDVAVYVRIFERGEFHWKEFSERPLQRIEEVTFSPQVRFAFMQQWYFAIGFRSFAQKRFQYISNVRQFESTFLSAGPTTMISIRVSPLSLVEIRGWKEFQRQSGGKIQEYSNMSMNVRYYF